MPPKPTLVESLESRLLLTATPTARPVADINKAGPGSDPAQFVELDGHVYFVAGLERTLYRANGQSERPTKILQGSGGKYDPIGLVSLNGRLFFDGWSQAGGHELWTSDGTPEGTHQVADIFPGRGDSDPRDFTSLDGITYFTALDFDATVDPVTEVVRNLWRTDGTAQGTWKVSQLRTYRIDPDPGPFGFFAFKGFLYFAYDDGTGAGYELWRTDGTTQGTGLFTEIRPGAAGGFDNRIQPEFAAVGPDAFVFRALSPTGTLDLYRSDGTAAGTRLVRGFGAGDKPRVVPTYVDSLVTGPGGNVYLVGNNGARPGLYRTNGTEDGTLLVNDDWDPGAGFGGVFGPLLPANGQLFLRASNPTTGLELWVTDGTRTGTHAVKDIIPGKDTPFPYIANKPTFPEFAVRGSEIFFTAWTPANGIELYRSDGTTDGTVLLRDINPGYRDAAPTGLLVTSTGTLYFAADDGFNGREPWTSDGTEAGTSLLAQVDPSTYSSNPHNMFNVGGTLIFTATTAAGDYLFKSDGKAKGTFPISSVVPLPANSLSYVSAAATRRLLFYAGSDATAGAELWRSDGTAEGTYRVTDIRPGPASSMASAFAVAVLGNRCVFLADTGDGAGPRLWVSDGTAAGTHRVTATGPTFAGDARFTRAGDALFCVDSSGFLWRTDGTDAGTWRVETAAGPVSPSPGDWDAYNGSLYFQSVDPVYGAELFRSDGTPDGTHIVADVWPGAQGSNPQSLEASGGYLYFVAYSPDTTELFRTDGTPQGTVPVKNFGPGYTVCLPNTLVDVGGTLVFNVPTWDEGVWRTTGTTDSTYKLSGFDIGGPHAMTSPVAVDDVVYYYYGQGIYYTDGTAAGSGQVRGTPEQLSAFSGPNFQLDGNGSLFFQLGEPSTGGELWVIPKADPPGKPKDFNADSPSAPLASASLLDPAATATAADAPATDVRLTWTPGADMNGYRIERSTSPTFDTIDATWPVNANFDHFTDTTATAPAVYYYRIVAYNPAGDSTPATLVVDRLPPAVASASFQYLTGQRRISARFTEDVSKSLQAGDLTLHNLTTGVDLPATAATLSWDPDTFTATWTFASLDDGNYRATLAASGVNDPALNTLNQDYALDFSFMNGDANHDLHVDFNDLVKLAQNYNTTGKTYADGDFNADGNVDFNDLVILAQRYNTALPAPGATAAPAAPASTSFAADWAAATASPTLLPATQAPAKKKPKPQTVFSVTPVAKPTAAKPKAPQHRSAKPLTGSSRSHYG